MTLKNKLEKADATIQVLTKLLIETRTELNDLKLKSPPKKGKQILLHPEIYKKIELLALIYLSVS